MFAISSNVPLNVIGLESMPGMILKVTGLPSDLLSGSLITNSTQISAELSPSAVV